MTKRGRRNVTDGRTRLAGRAIRGAPGTPAGVAYRMLGSLSEADDAVQEAWLRLSRADTERHREPRRLADDGRRRGSVSTCCARASRGGRSRWAARRRNRWSTRTDGGDPSRKRCWPTRSVSPCWWSWRRWLRPSGSRSCCTTCSPCPSTRSHRSSGARPPPRGSSPAVRGAACRERTRLTGAESGGVSERSSMPSSRRCAAAISRGCWPCSIRTCRRPRATVRAVGPGGRARCAARATGPRARSWSARRAIRAAGARRRDGVGARCRVRAGRLFRVLSFTFAGGKIAQVEVIGDPARLRELELAVLDGGGTV